MLATDVIRALTPADHAACVALSRDRDWPPEEHKWRLLLEVGEGYGIDDPDGGLAGSVVLTRYAPGAVAISMMLVAARRERQGLGTRLMAHALERAGDGPVFLYATELGRPLYERLGFRTAVTSTMLIGRYRGAADGASRAATEADRGAIRALDAAALGVDRGALLDRLPRFADRIRVLERDGAPFGYAAAWRNGEVTAMGPVIAGDPAAARSLVAGLGADIDGPVRLDLTDDQPELQAWASEQGLVSGMVTSFMVHGGRSLPGERSRVVAPFMQALG